MTTYRTGNHQPQNLYRGDQYIGVMFDPADTALLVDAMEGHTPDIDHARGAAEALAHVRRLLDRAAEPHEQLFASTVREMLRVAAAELGVDEHAPSGPLAAPESAERTRVEGIGYPEPPQPLSARLRPPTIRGVHRHDGERCLDGCDSEVCR